MSGLTEVLGLTEAGDTLHCSPAAGTRTQKYKCLINFPLDKDVT